MRIAIPLVQGQFSLHFGHCDQFAVFEVSDETKKIISRNNEVPPNHAPGVLPQWLGGMGVNVIIAGGMGQRAQQLFVQNGVKVVIGAQSGNPEELISAYLDGSLVTGDNICDH
ncbi:MAG: NifB/NifX family molybdenum-iron cluster-binding protein [Sedimentisphaerales bacterium]|nr:NifB/NifX family molybdenum-iron cluster-binding protein [Sedimentisphaerales bacterium]